MSQQHKTEELVEFSNRNRSWQ